MSSAPFTVPLLLAAPARTQGQPLTVGVPFPKGTLRNSQQVHLLDESHRPVPVQTTVLANWPDGTVCWLLVDCVPRQVERGQTCWTLQPGKPAEGPDLIVLRREQGLSVETGAAAWMVGHGPRFLQFRSFHSAGTIRDLIEPFSVQLLLTDQKGTVHAPALRPPVLAGEGSVRQTLFLGGAFSRPPCDIGIELSFFADTALVRLRLTVINPLAARHRGGLWDLGDPRSMRFRDLSLLVSVPGQKPPVLWSTLEPGCGDGIQSTTLQIVQVSSGGPCWDSRNHVNGSCKVACPSRGYQAARDGATVHAARASPTVAIQGDEATLTVALPEFWEQFPRAINTVGRGLRLALFPAEFGDLFELQPGEQKTHTVWLHLGPGAGTTPLEWVHSPVVVRPAPDWVIASGVFPHLALGGVPRLDDQLGAIVDGPHSFFARREIIDEYGWRHFGEVYADHENAHYNGKKPIISHYNNQYDLVLGLLRQYARTGDVRWWQLADPLARHVIDIDIYHTTQDRAAYSGGMFWHTDHYRDAATCTHRSYSKANAVPGQPYGGGPSCEHNYPTGLLHYYYLTGDPLAREAVLDLAAWVLRMDDGSRTLLGLVEDGPTGLASATRDPGYHGPGRGAGNSINALLDAWLLTGERPYLDYAEGLVRRCIHPHDDIAARGLLAVEDRWSYTVFLSVLVRYLDLKAEADEIERMYAHARASLLHYASWMAEHERPYFDQAERLEYPTETWAAQELRKANVLRLAAPHADEPLRGRLLQRGEEFAERAWSDLLRFDSRFTTRPQAILLREGPVDLYLRRRSLRPAPRPREPYDFGQPGAFVPQKQRVRAMLKTPRGLALACLRLLNPRRWWRYWTRHRR